nr:cytosolic protein [Bacillota bacterium]
MKIVDEIYAMYRNQLRGDEEDLLALIMGLFMDHDRDDLLMLIEEMSREELLQMVTLYTYQLLRLKLAREGVQDKGEHNEPAARRMH